MLKRFLSAFLLSHLACYAFSQTYTSDTVSRTFTLKNFYQYNPHLERKVDSVFNTLTDAQRAGQMIVQAAGKLGKPTTVINQLVKEQKLGGVLLLGGNTTDFKQLVASLNKQNTGLPLLYSADAEPSLINRKIAGTQKVKNAADIKNVEESRLTAGIINKDLLAMGIRHNFAPACDLSPDNVAIGNRSFGSNRDTVVWLSDAFIQTTQEAGIVATAKHFPGHGFVKGDTHAKLVYIDGELKEVDTYRPLITNGVLSVMVGHIAVVNNETYQTNGLPASCSRKIVTDLLQHELGFKGLVVTDAMNMGAVSKIPQSTFKAVQAGCDMILMPPNENSLHQSILQEMKASEAFKNQVYTSVKKIIRLKICLGLL
jgi:beta-N-acetylhexosaminidase